MGIILHYPTGSAQDAQPTTPSAAGGVFRATQVLGSVGAPIANLRAAPSNTTSSGSDLLYFSNDHSTGPNSGGD
ncbi:hypothetical protein ACJ73_07972 [Blastomyces percursus]|uniref:Uncharacterized protein n=1 Tax=Blastomyces percursus TaxID=1658174 RepID=A0A1J9QKF7_9EURO|nr:hypothetical protein ACJ73_07972 [Blastomyces percursus]